MDMQAVMRFRNKNNTFARLLGIDITELTLGHSKSHMVVSDKLRNPQGSIHGGVIYTIADVTGGNAASSYGEKVATLDSDFHYLRPALKLESLTAEAVEIKHGRHVSVYDVKVTDQDGTVLAAGIFSYSSLGMPIETEPET